MPFSIRKNGKKFQVVNSETGDVKGTHSSEDDAKQQLAALHANDADKDKGHMDIQLKSMAAELVPVDDPSDPVGSFHVVISSEKRDRDGDLLWADEWETPLPGHIQIIGDHKNNEIMSTIGSGPPTLEADNKIHVRGTYATTGYAQDARKLVNGKHLRHLSVAYREKRGEKGAVARELINASFVNVPSNTDAIVLESKSFEGEGSQTAREFAKAVAKELSALQPDAIGKALADAGLFIIVDESNSTVTVKHGTDVLGTHKFSQAPEAHGDEPPDSTADQAKREATALAHAKAAAFQITSHTGQYTEQELNNA